MTPRFDLVLAAATLCTLALAAPAHAQLRPAGSWGAQASVTGTTFGGEHVGTASVTGGDGTGNTKGMASASLRDGALHAYAWTTNDPQLPRGCRPDMLSCNWRVGAAVAYWDSVEVSPGGNYKAGDVITWRFAIDGSKTRGRWWSANVAEAWSYVGGSATGWNTPAYVRPGNVTVVEASYRVPSDGSSFMVYVYGAISVYAEGGAVTDYSNTMRFDWELPAGYTYRSASGQFMTAAVPEPGAAALWSAGLAGLAFIARRRRVPS